MQVEISDLRTKTSTEEVAKLPLDSLIEVEGIIVKEDSYSY